MLGREQEVEICGSGGGAVPDEAIGGFVLRAASHVGAEEGGGLALLLFIPRDAVADEVAVAHSRRFGSLQIGPERGVAGGDLRFGEVAIEQAELGVEAGVAVGLCLDHRGGEVARAGQDGAEVGVGQAEAADFGAGENKIIVTPGGDAALDAGTGRVQAEYGCILSTLVRYKRRPPALSSRELSSVF